MPPPGGAVRPGHDRGADAVRLLHPRSRAEAADPRLLAAVARNSHTPGIGIDEDTAALVDGDELRVVGRSHVYLVDVRSIEHTAQSGTRPLGIESAHGTTVHVRGALPRSADVG